MGKQNDLEREAAKFPPGTRPVPQSHREPVHQVEDDTPGKVKIRNVATGEVREFWPIDAKDQIRSGEFEWIGEPPKWANLG
jgi:hypothetical protein